jgi:hypothetical protein
MRFRSKPLKHSAGVCWRNFYMAIKKPDAYLWTPSAILNSPRVEDLSPLEELWYRRALDRSFDDEGISSDPVKAAIRIGRKCTPAAAEKILRIFFVPKPRDPSKVINPRQEIERKNAIKALKKFSDAGKESGRKRREKKALEAERRSNNVATINKQINKDKKEEELRVPTASPPAPEPAGDPRKNHPALVAIVDLANVYPPKEIWDDVIDQLGTDIDHARLRKCFVTWIGRSYNKQNFDWAFDWYVNNRIPTKGQQNGNGTHSKPSSEREKSAQRTVNSLEFIDKLEREGHAERSGQALPGSSSEDGPEVDQPRQLTGTH